MNDLSPAPANLLKSTLIAVALALVTLVLFILPAEYNIDPTGVGSKLGITVLAQPVPGAVTPSISAGISDTHREDTVEVMVPAGRGVEYKFKVQKLQTLKYQWKTDGASLYLDLHGEPQGDTSGYFESFTIASANEMSGQFIAPFDGAHGWYFKNTSDKDIKVTLTTSGPYEIIGLKQ